jgi:hypothetical protein
MLPAGATPLGGLAGPGADQPYLGRYRPWVASPAHPGPFLVRGRQLDGPRRLRFGEGPQPAAELLLPAAGTAHSQDSDWFNWPSYSRLRGGGCYAYQVDSANRHPDHRLRPP